MGGHIETGSRFLDPAIGFHVLRLDDAAMEGPETLD